jgi:hypothetical protein
MLADIATGNTSTADVFFLVALILALLAAILYAVRRPDASPFAPVLLSLAVASLSLSWLVL